jgi:hypothetical protein
LIHNSCIISNNSAIPNVLVPFEVIIQTVLKPFFRLVQMKTCTAAFMNSDHGLHRSFPSNAYPCIGVLIGFWFLVPLPKYMLMGCVAWWCIMNNFLSLKKKRD